MLEYLKNIKIDKKDMLKYICFGLGIFMMVNNLCHSGLWGDEWCEYDFSQWPFTGGDYNFYYIVTHTYQPPLYNFVMHFWLMISSSVVWFRLFNLIPGIISLIALYKTVKELIGIELYASLSVVALSCCYQWIYFVQECAEYCLMLMFLFLSLLYWIRLVKGKCATSKEVIRYYILFMLMIVGAIYSQYGAAIVGLPLIIIVYVKSLEYIKDKHVFMRIQAIFACGAALGLLLFWFFLRIQTARMQDVYNYHLRNLSMDMLGNLMTNMGKVIHWILHFPDNSIILFACIIVGIVILLYSCCCIYRYRGGTIQSRLMIAFLSTYVFHYLLVAKMLYARGQIEARYSLFFLPILTLVLVVIINNIVKIVNNSRILLFCLAILVVVPLSISAAFILQNWNKAYDNDIAKIWSQHVTEEDYGELIYFCGYPSYPIKYYTEQYGFDYSLVTKNMTDVEISNETVFDDRFWLWRTGWSNENYDSLIEAVEKEGYKTEVFLDYGEKGAIVYCSR